ncbi:MAG: phenylalanine--tRNA ligase subunit beta [Betaproteobacteria bacterium]|nr:phenylalanine--tRNA ligase subunit beta [Betaproteobacteria bacterium]
MKFSEHWLRTFVNPPLSTRELADALTMGGVEVETIEPVAPPFERVVVGEVLSVDRHPDADRLTVCQVNAGAAPLVIVCGAPNVRPGVRAATALVGARLPAGEIKAAKVRGVESHGMLCSAKELGLSGDAEGVMLLGQDAPAGTDVRVVLDLDDRLLTTKPTPNRGDCLSILGMAREVAAVTGCKLTPVLVKPAMIAIQDRLPVMLEARDACPRYCGRMVRGVNARVATPQWIAERLARSGIHSINPVVDITNYTMLELGQPLHAFDGARLAGGLRVRFARAGEKITLLNAEVLELTSDFLVIADERDPVALAGIMGGMESAVVAATHDVFLESAYFDPDVIAGKSRLLGFGSDSSYRFERGVDFEGTVRALERATQLVLEICGGQAGPITEARAQLPRRRPVTLRLTRVQDVLGIKLGAKQVGSVLRRLGFEFTAAGDKFRVVPPSYRFDIAIEEDLIEEVARIHGYDNIPAAVPAAPAVMLPAPEARRDAAAIRRQLVARDYQEAVTYSFVDREWEADFCANAEPIALANPIASQMSVMRSSLIGSLVDRVAFNANHRQTRVRLFEIGRCFERGGDGNYLQPVRIGGIAYGDALQEQWGVAARNVDFYDVKSDVMALLPTRDARFDAAAHPALHPGKSARISRGGTVIGWIGELHPRWQQKYDLRLAPVLFELDFEHVARGGVPVYNEIPKVPPVRRDLAVILDEAASYEAILEELSSRKPVVVADIWLFDVYRGPAVQKGKKSLAFRVLLQDTHKTLTDAEIDSAVSQLIQVLQKRFDAKLR